MAPFVFWRVLCGLGLQSAKNRFYTGSSITTFHSVLPFYNAACVVMSDCTISLGNATVPPDFLPIILTSLAYLFSEIYASRLGAGLGPEI